MKNLLIVLVLVVLLAAGVSAYIFYNQLQQEKTELVSLEQRIEIVKTQITQTEEKITQLDQQNQDLQQKIGTLEKQVTGYDGQVVSLKDKRSQIHTTLQNQRAQLSSLNQDLQKLTGEKDDLASRMSDLTAQSQSANTQIAQLSTAKKQLEDDIKKYIKPASGVELDKIVVKMSQTPEGAIVEINDKHGFAVVDMGADSGVIVGDMLGVYRNNELIAKVVVEKVFKDFSSVVPSEGFTNVRFKISDKVSLLT